MTQLFYDSTKLRIRVCGGMNCSAFGGGRVLEEAFEAALREHGGLDKVELLRAHCLGECPHGPCVRIDGERFYQVQAADAPRLVQEEVLPKL